MAIEFEQNLGKKLWQALSIAKRVDQNHLANYHNTTSADYTEERILVAVSGGADSTALLLGLKQIAQEGKIKLSACHVNHHLRAAESDDDESFCRQLCGDLSIHIDVRSVEPSQANRSEEALREIRYQYLLEAAKQEKVRYIATAHTLDDQIETLLFRLFRGTASKGFTGMSLCRSLMEDIYLIRPLLSVSKQACERYLAEMGIAARVDSSNLNEDYTRNYLRNRLFPLIEARFPDFKSRIEQFRDVVDMEEEFLGQLTRQILAELEDRHGEPVGWMIESFRKQSTAIKRRLIVQALVDRGIEVTYKRVAEILNLVDCSDKQDLVQHNLPNQAALTLNEIWQVRLTPNEMVWVKKEVPSVTQLTPVTVKVPGNNIVLLLGRVLKVEALDTSDLDDAKLLKFPQPWADEALVDLSSVKLPIVLRTRHSGDFIQPFGMSEKVRLKKYLHTHKRPNHSGQLSSLDLVLADQEEVLWVPGVGLSEKLRVKHRPSHRLSWLLLAPDQVTVT